MLLFQQSVTQLFFEIKSRQLPERAVISLAQWFSTFFIQRPTLQSDVTKLPPSKIVSF